MTYQSDNLMIYTLAEVGPCAYEFIIVVMHTHHVMLFTDVVWIAQAFCEYV